MGLLDEKGSEAVPDQGPSTSGQCPPPPPAVSPACSGWLCCWHREFLQFIPVVRAPSWQPPPVAKGRKAELRIDKAEMLGLLVD